MSQKTSVSKNFTQPDERRYFQGHGHLDLVSLGDGSSIGKGIFEPGWRWSNDVKPIAGTQSCQASHTGYCISGSMVVQMDNGEQFRIQAGEAFRIEPGHDAWVDGNERCELLDFTGYEEYARRAHGKEAA